MLAIVAGAALVARVADDDPPHPVADTASHDSVEGTRIAAAGDIACDPASASFNDGQGKDLQCRQAATSDLLVDADYAAVLVLGDAQYEEATTAAFAASYEPTWGRVKSITAPAVGNHEYRTPGATGYFSYFGEAAGDATRGYYSFDLAGWHLISLNSNCEQVGGCEAGSPQEQWLRRDLTASPARCTLAFWHHPHFSSGRHGGSSEYAPFWSALYDANAEIVLTGHDHDYERFAPQTSEGDADTARGVRGFVVGTGGKDVRSFPDVAANSEAHDASSLGVLELTLGRDAYAWRFRPAVGSFVDSGSYACH